MGNCIQRDVGGESTERMVHKSKQRKRSSTVSTINFADDTENDNNHESTSKKSTFNPQIPNSLNFSLSSLCLKNYHNNKHNPNNNNNNDNNNDNDNDNDDSNDIQQSPLPSSPSSLSLSPSLTSFSNCIIANYRRTHNDEVQKYSLLYHKKGADTIQLMHYIFKYIWEGKNYLSPVEDLLKFGGGCVLNVGCGSGTWSLEMGSEYPLTRFFGVDVAPVFPTNIKPNNVRFFLLDVLYNGLPFEDNKFDYIYMNSVGILLTEKQWSQLLNELARVLKPNGRFEFANVDSRLNDEGPVSVGLSSEIQETFNRARGILLPGQISQLLENNNRFSNIQVIKKIAIFYEWENNVIDLLNEFFIGFFDSIKSLILPRLKIASEEYDALIKEMVEVEIKEHRSTLTCHRVFCRKKIIDNSIDDDR